MALYELIALSSLSDKKAYYIAIWMEVQKMKSFSWDPCISSIQEPTINMETKSEPVSISDEQSSSPAEILPARSQWQYWKHYLTSRDGWVGDYVC